MANICQNILKVYGITRNDEVFKDVIKLLDSNLEFQEPVKFELLNHIKPHDSVSDILEHWGCHEVKGISGGYSDDTNTLSLFFETDWTPPLHAFSMMDKLLDLFYWEEVEGFAGVMSSVRGEITRLKSYDVDSDNYKQIPIDIQKIFNMDLFFSDEF